MLIIIMVKFIMTKPTMAQLGMVKLISGLPNVGNRNYMNQ